MEIDSVKLMSPESEARRSIVPLTRRLRSHKCNHVTFLSRELKLTGTRGTSSNRLPSWITSVN